MNCLIFRGLTVAALAAGFGMASSAVGQERSVLDRMFGNEPQAAGQEMAQDSSAELVLRIERLEQQNRELTGTVEQLQFRNRQLESQIRSLGAIPGGPSAASAPGGLPQQPQPPQPVQPTRPAAQVAPAPPAPMPPAGMPGRRSDVFDPTQNPNAPGAPRPLGTIAAGPPPIIAADPPVGAPGGRGAGDPLDLSTLSSSPGRAGGTAERPMPSGDGMLPPPPARNPNATGAVASIAAPSDSPRDTYDLAYGYVLRKDYALAEEAFQSFLKMYPNDRRAPDAQFWLGESLYQRQRYDAAASAFLDLSTKHTSHSKAPEALLRLGQSLAAMKQKEMACATLAEIGRKYPRAPTSVKQGVDREQKRVAC
jgi:tol-pal system protein YbgF